MLVDESETEDADLEAEAARLADLLAEMPGPDPNGKHPVEPGDWIQAAQAHAADNQEFLFPWELEKLRPAAQPSLPTSPAGKRTRTQRKPISDQPPGISGRSLAGRGWRAE